ncbi:MAG: hypothetical protein PVG83_07720, partial [Acidimicrobiia bacterium]
MTGRRAAFGVAWKNARRNRKRTFYLVLMIAIPVMVAVVTSAFVRLSDVSAEESITSQFGGANVQIERSTLSPEAEAWVEETIET